MKEKIMKNGQCMISRLIKNQSGISTVEVLVIIAVLVAAAILFKENLLTFVGHYFEKLNLKAGGLF